MQRPVPDMFQGSTPTGIIGGATLGSDIERALGGSAIVLGLGAGMLAFTLSGHTVWFAMKIGCIVLLAISVLGLWLKGRAADAPRQVTGGIYHSALARMTHAGRAVCNVPAEGGYAGLAGLIADLTSVLRRTQAGRARLETDFAATHANLMQGREQAHRIAGEIANHAKMLSDVETRVSAADTQLVRQAESVALGLDTAENAVTRAIDGIATIAASVRATTTGAQQMTIAAVQMADVAHNTHRCIAGLDDRTAKMMVALDYIERTLQVAASLGQAACSEAAARDAPGSAFARIALELREVAGSCQPALADAAAAISELVSQTAEANRRTMEITELIGANHDIGRAVSHAVERQGQEIARILTELYEARPGFATLRAGVEAVTLASSSRTEASDTIKTVVRALPAQAEKLARLLQAIPAKSPPADH